MNMYNMQTLLHFNGFCACVIDDNDGGDGDDSSPVGIIVGVLVTVVIVVVIVIVIIGVLYWYKKKQGKYIARMIHSYSYGLFVKLCVQC